MLGTALAMEKKPRKVKLRIEARKTAPDMWSVYVNDRFIWNFKNKDEAEVVAGNIGLALRLLLKREDGGIED